jgi:hypothetical protein
MIHYVLCSIPFYAMAAAVLIIPVIRIWVGQINVQSRIFKNCLALLSFGIICFVIFSITKINTIGRDKDILNDLKTLNRKLPEGQLVATCTPTLWNFQLAEYLYRFYHISLVPVTHSGYNFMIMNKDCVSEVPAAFEPVQAQTKEYFLFRRK